MERTFAMIKPDAVRRKLIGDIISRVEKRNFTIAAMKMLVPSRELAERHYAAHKGKEHFQSLIGFITSGPVVAMIIEGEDAVKLFRTTMGATDPEHANPGTIRGDFTISLRENLIHGSDSAESACAEIAMWFPELS